MWHIVSEQFVFLERMLSFPPIIDLFLREIFWWIYEPFCKNIRDILRQIYGKRGFIFVHAILYDNQISSKQ